MMHMKEYFYFPEWTIMLDLLLGQIPEKEPFNLFELSRIKKVKHKNEFTDYLFDNKESYINLARALVAANLADDVYTNQIKLTDEGRLLKIAGSWTKYQRRLRLKKNASYMRIYREANWLPITIIGFILTTVVSVTMSRVFDTQKESRIHLKIDLVLPSDTVLRSHSIDSTFVLTP